MRISTNTLYGAGTTRITDLQSAMQRTQQQIATGRKVLVPSDDPVAASQVLNLEQGQAMNAQYASNRRNAGNALSEQESVLASVDTLVQDVRTLLVQAGNGSLDDAQRGYLAVELDGQFGAMLALSNSKDSLGNYLFSGYQTDVPAYARTSPGADFGGDAGRRELQVDSSRRVTTSVSALQLFENIDTGTAAAPGTVQNIFATLRELSDALKASTATAAGKSALQSAAQGADRALDTLLDRVLAARAAVGAQQKEIDALEAAGSAKEVYYTQAKSALQDVDYTEVISRFSQQQTTLDAAMKSFKLLSQLSLFSVI